MPKTLAKPASKTKTAPKVKGTYGTMYYVKDMAAAVRLYTEKLGLKPAYESPEWTEFPVGGHSLCLHSTKGAKAITTNGVLILHVDGIVALIERLKAQGVKVLSEPAEVHPGAWGAQIADADGSAVSFYEGPKSC